jgi:hypothetical protein
MFSYFCKDMKKIIFCLIVTIGFCLNAIAQTTHLQWTRLQQSVNAQANQVIQFAVDAQGNSFCINRTQDASSFYISNRLISYDASGVKKWDIQTDSCFTACQEEYKCIVPLGNGDVVFIGQRNTSANVWTLILKKYFSNGSLAWKKSIVNDNAIPTKAILDKDKNIIVSLDVDGITTGRDFTMANFNGNNGNIIWWTTIPDGGTTNSLDESIADFAVDKNGMVYGIGMASDGATVFNLMVSKWDSSGAIVYSNAIDNNLIGLSAINPMIKADNLGNLYTCQNGFKKATLKKLIDSNTTLIFSKQIKMDSAKTQISSFDYINHKLYLFGTVGYAVTDTSFQGFFNTNKLPYLHKVDTNANDVFQKSLMKNFDKSPNNQDFGNSFQMLNCKNQLVLASIQSKQDTLPFYIIQKTDTNGTLLWYDSSRADVGQGIFIGVDANCNAYKNYDAFNGGMNMISIVKKYTDALNIPQSLTQLSQHFLQVAYTNNGVMIDADQVQILSAKVLNLNGQVVQHISPIHQQIIVKQNDLPTGIYIVVVQTDKGAIAQKISL